MLALRDQENLVHGHQTAAASKPLNQGTRQLPPKTPGNKAPKTPFRIPLNDENGPIAFGGGKTALKTGGKGSESLATGIKKGAPRDKNAFVTPMGPRVRAPLGQKTTNAKAKPFQTPALGPSDNSLSKSKQKSVSARKPKPKASHPSPVKLNILADPLSSEEEQDIEYMPPRPIDLPDVPDDLPPLDLTPLLQGDPISDSYRHALNEPGADGLSYIERQALADVRQTAIADAKLEAQLERDLQISTYACPHVPDCLGAECKNMPRVRAQAERAFAAQVAAIEGSASAMCDTKTRSKAPTPAPTPGPTAAAKPTAAPTVSGPSTVSSRHAARALSLQKSAPQPPPTTSSARQAPKPATRTPLLSSAAARVMGRKERIIAPTEPKPTAQPAPMRHAAARAASNSTMGYARGRAARQELRADAVLPGRRTGGFARRAESGMGGNASKNGKHGMHDEGAGEPDQTLPPAEFVSRYGVPRFGSDMWFKCRMFGSFGDEGLGSEVVQQREGNEGKEDGVDGERDWYLEEAERDFELVL